MINQTLISKIEELEQTKYELKTLQGLLAICSYCKKIRDTNDEWIPLEEYLHKHSDILLTHGICHGCYERVIQEIPEQVAQFLGKGLSDFKSET